MLKKPVLIEIFWNDGTHPRRSKIQVQYHQSSVSILQLLRQFAWASLCLRWRLRIAWKALSLLGTLLMAWKTPHSGESWELPSGRSWKITWARRSGGWENWHRVARCARLLASNVLSKMYCFEDLLDDHRPRLHGGGTRANLAHSHRGKDEAGAARGQWLHFGWDLDARVGKMVLLILKAYIVSTTLINITKM